MYIHILCLCVPSMYRYIVWGGGISSLIQILEQPLAEAMGLSLLTYLYLHPTFMLRLLNFGLSCPSLTIHIPQCTYVYTQVRTPKYAKPKDLIQLWKLQVGDEVCVISGKEKGKIGKVLQCDVFRNMLKVEGINLQIVKDEKGKDSQREKKIHYSNCLLMDPVLHIPTRIGIINNGDGTLSRYAKKSGTLVPWQTQEPTIQHDPEYMDGPKDTPPELALQRTYDHATGDPP